MLPLTNQKVTINTRRQIAFMPVQKHTHRAESSARLKALGVSHQRGSSHGVDTPGVECTSDRGWSPCFMDRFSMLHKTDQHEEEESRPAERKRPAANDAPQAMGAAWSARSAYTLNWDRFLCFISFAVFKQNSLTGHKNNRNRLVS